MNGRSDRDTGAMRSDLPGWADHMEALKAVAEPLMAMCDRNDTEARRQDMLRYTFGGLAIGYLNYVNSDAARPTFTPLYGRAMNYGGPNPDYAYMHALVEPEGIYCISGYRGSICFVEIVQSPGTFLRIEAFDHIMAASERTTESSQRPKTVLHDLDDLTMDENGYFSVILSAKRPDGYEGDWWQLSETTHSLLMRKCSADWVGEIDPRIAINRLDRAAPHTPEQISARLSAMPDYVNGLIGFDIKLARYYRDHYGINTIRKSHLMASNNTMPGQMYYDGGYQFQPDEALILETEIPETYRYWQTLVADNRFATVDWFEHQSSLNCHQARLDTDGRFRAVIAARDPGVPNWLDTAGEHWGVIQFRFNKCSSYPDPTVTKVKLDKVRQHLPGDTPVVTHEERRQSLLQRREAAQFRQLW